MKELTLQEAALAWAHGKRVQATSRNGAGEFYDIGKPGSTSGMWNAAVFNDVEKHKFRLAPEPPAKRYRPWTSEEVPVGAQVRYKGNSKSFRMLIVCDREPCLLSESSHWKLQDLLVSMEHSMDGGKTWAVCGVEVEA